MLRQIFQQLNLPTPDADVLKAAVEDFSGAVKTFTGHTMPPCAYKLKVYDHAFIEHVVEQTEKLMELGLSLSLLSSKFLEASNKTAKAITWRPCRTCHLCKACARPLQRARSDLR